MLLAGISALVTSTLLSVGCGRREESAVAPMVVPLADSAWQQRFCALAWVAYSPSTGNPNMTIEPSVDEIRKDLSALRLARFTGLVTYGSSGVLGRELPALAESEGFKGLVVGVWNPKNTEEIAAAKAAASNPVVIGFCVGNEGLGKRYSFQELAHTMQDLRNATRKPVTTAEEIDDYYQQRELLSIGDWLFPNAHPFFHDRLSPKSAVEWTRREYEELKSRTDRFLIFKEVGLPTAGDEEGVLSETNQERYYLELAKTPVRFVYFEAFDLAWKNHLPVEPHWGLFRSDRSPKPCAVRLMK
jgi:exo-beta-1,3-glucanase (GH17 family)